MRHDTGKGCVRKVSVMLRLCDGPSRKAGSPFAPLPPSHRHPYRVAHFAPLATAVGSARESVPVRSISGSDPLAELARPSVCAPIRSETPYRPEGYMALRSMRLVIRLFRSCWRERTEQPKNQTRTCDGAWVECLCPGPSTTPPKKYSNRTWTVEWHCSLVS